MKLSIIIISTLILVSLNVDGQSLNDSQLVAAVKKTIKPQYNEIIIFSNGTYQVITADSLTINLADKAKEAIINVDTTYGRVLEKDNLVITIKGVDGWIIDSSIEGLYSFISSKEFNSRSTCPPTHNDIINFARQNRKRDRSERRIIFQSH